MSVIRTRRPSLRHLPAAVAAAGVPGLAPVAVGPSPDDDADLDTTSVAGAGAATGVAGFAAGSQLEDEDASELGDGIEGDDDGDGEADGTRTVGYVGVQADQTYVQQPVTAVPGFIGDYAVRAVDRLAEIPQRVPALFRAAFLGEERDPLGPIGVVGVGDLPMGSDPALPCRCGQPRVSRGGD